MKLPGHECISSVNITIQFAIPSDSYRKNKKKIGGTTVGMPLVYRSINVRLFSIK